MAGIASVFMNRISRFLLNKKVLSGFLEDELDERQVEVSVRDEQVVLHNLRLRAETLNAFLPPACGVHVVSATIKKLTVKVPRPSITSTWSWIAMHVNPVEVCVDDTEFVLEPQSSEEEVVIDRGGLDRSLCELRAALTRVGEMHEEDIPDEEDEDEEPDAWEGEQRKGGTEDKEETRNTLVRWLEKVLGATKLTVTNLAVRYRHLALEDGEEDGDEDGLSPCPSNRTGQSSRGGRRVATTGEIAVVAKRLEVLNVGDRKSVV